MGGSLVLKQFGNRHKKHKLNTKHLKGYTSRSPFGEGDRGGEAKHAGVRQNTTG